MTGAPNCTIGVWSRYSNGGVQGIAQNDRPLPDWPIGMYLFPFYDAWQLPDSFAGLEGQHVWLRTTDLLGVQRTWRGDWRQPADNTVPTPPDCQ